jgi:3-hydroxyacyl-CoA dehydrogenase
LPGRAGELIWHTLAHTLAYAAARYPEIAGSLVDIDRAMEWGFAWELGPFAIWDALGIAETAARIEQAGIILPEWLHRMITRGHSAFYRREKGTLQIYHPESGSYVPVEQDPLVETIAALKAKQPPLAENEAASLLDAGDGVRLLEFHSKMNALDSALFPILQRAIDELHGNATGLIIANDGPHFSLGANLKFMLSSAEGGDWEAIDQLIVQGQILLLALRSAPKPVVAAPFLRALGGGAEICLAAHRVVAHAEVNIGLVEFNVGLIPGWGGCKEMVRRHVQAGSPLVGLRRILELITQARTSTSAYDAKRLGLLAADDRIVMHRGHLIHAARQSVLEMAEHFSPPSTTRDVYAGGSDALNTLLDEIEAKRQSGQFLEHDTVIARSLAHVLCGEDAAGWRNEQDFLNAERQQFLQLISTSATQARIRQILAAGKPLRN